MLQARWRATNFGAPTASHTWLPLGGLLHVTLPHSFTPHSTPHSTAVAGLHLCCPTGHAATPGQQRGVTAPNGGMGQRGSCDAGPVADLPEPQLHPL